MFELFGFFTQNTRKALYSLEAIDTDYEFHYVDLSKGAQRSPEFLAMHALGKVPVLKHGARILFESGAIARYTANATASPLYPNDAYERAVVDQWLDYFACHPGRWLTSIYFNTVIKPRMGLGDTDPAVVAESQKFARQQLKFVEEKLSSDDWLANSRESIADWCAYAYVEQVNDIEFSLQDYPNVDAWRQRLAASAVVERANRLIEHGQQQA